MGMEKGVALGLITEPETGVMGSIIDSSMKAFICLSFSCFTIFLSPI